MLGLSLNVARVEASSGVEHQVVTCFWRSTLVRDVFLAFNSRLQRRTGVQRPFSSFKRGQSMDYYILLESPGCQLNWKRAILSSVAPENPL